VVGNVREFLGLPYAKPPIGRLRFAAAEPAEAWRDIRDATRFGPVCPQGKSPTAMTGPSAEDCLTLNVFAPQQAHGAAALPVMVFLHGGAFVTGGSSAFHPESLAGVGPVVIVTVNYRIGALGFLSLPALDAARPGVASGSDGIRDQQLALRWVQKNIAAVGGDPHDVTVFGESAGSMSACLHLLAPSSQALRKRVIMESGTCLSGGMAAKTKEKSVALSQALADDLCPGAKDQLACLREQPIDALTDWGADHDIFGAGWGPTIEGEGGVLPEAPEQLLAKQNSLAPFIIGVNQNEWLYFQITGRDPVLTSIAALDDRIVALFGDQAARVEAQYPATSDAEANDAYVQLMTDIRLRCPTRTFARMAAARRATPHLYSFEEGPAYHSLELGYLFGDPLVLAFGGAPLSQAMQVYWTQFALNGAPDSVSPFAWPAYDRQSERYSKLADPPTASSGFAPQCDFWDDFVSSTGTVIAPL
jgi:para-nitrobenzyl esterase